MRHIQDIIVTVKTPQIVGSLKKQLETHKAEFEEAHAAWHTHVVAALRTAADQIEAGDEKSSDILHRVIRLTEPRSHQGVIRQSLEMFEAAVDEEFELSPDQFQALMSGKWDWSDQFRDVNSTYVSVGRR